MIRMIRMIRILERSRIEVRCSLMLYGGGDALISHASFSSEVFSPFLFDCHSASITIQTIM